MVKFWWKNFDTKTIFFQNGKPVYSDSNCCCLGNPYIYFGSSAAAGNLSKVDSADNSTADIYDNTGLFGISQITIREQAGIIYFTSGNEIRSVNLDGTGHTVVYAYGAANVHGLSHDDNYLYFSSLGDQSLHRINFDGTGYTLLISGEFVYGLEVYGSYIYYADHINSLTIKRCNLDGTGITTLVNSSDSGDPVDVTLDASYIYWLDVKVYTLTDIGKIKRSAHDGSGVTTLYSPIETAVGAGSGLGICLWPTQSRIYFTFGQNLRRTNLDGTGHAVAFGPTGSFSLGGVHQYDP